MPGRKVIVLGGGVAGLSAAHELVERGFDVEVYEKAEALGGKARSNTLPGSGTGGRGDLPGEHGFRFFPGFYQHLPDTMRRIPFGANPNGVLDNLENAPQSAIAQEGKPLYVFPTHVPTTPADWALVLADWFDRSELGLEPGEATFFAERLLSFMTTCDARRLAELEKEKWWDYVEAETHSPQYQRLLATGLTRSLVAMRAEEASTRTIGSILVQMMMSMTSQCGSMDRVLNAPTSDAWIGPWVRYLESKGVRLVTGAAVEALEFDGASITGVDLRRAGERISVRGDHYVAAFPVDVAVTLFSEEMIKAAPSLAGLSRLKWESMNGIQFYLKRDVRCCAGHVIHADSPWAITSISQAQFWKGVDFSRLGDGEVRGIMSVDISDWTTPGDKTTTKTANQCTSAAEVANEVWAQLAASLAATAEPLSDAVRDGWFLDPSVSFPVVTNSQPLLINTVGSWDCRPDAATEIPNLFLASDYVRTNTDLATMEGANEAARRATNAILVAASSNAPPCGVWTFPEPAVFQPLKDLDKVLFDLHLPHPTFEQMDPATWGLKFPVSARYTELHVSIVETITRVR